MENQANARFTSCKNAYSFWKNGKQYFCGAGDAKLLEQSEFNALQSKCSSGFALCAKYANTQKANYTSCKNAYGFIVNDTQYYCNQWGGVIDYDQFKNLEKNCKPDSTSEPKPDPKPEPTPEPQVPQETAKQKCEKF